jgi:integrase
MAHIERRPLPSGKVRWVVRWDGPAGERLSEMFATKGLASEKLADVLGGKAGGAKKTLSALCDEFMAHARALEADGTRERSTVEQYRVHIDHIKRDALGGTKLHQLKTPEVQKALDRLRAGGMTAVTAKKVRSTLGRVVKFGIQRGALIADPVRATQIEEQARPDLGDEDGPVVIPSQAELGRLLEAADARAVHDKGRAAALVRTLLFCGLRMSEVRGLPNRVVNLSGPSPSLKVVQRADRWQTIGQPKSVKSRRKLPLGPDTAKALKIWTLAAPVGELGLVFPNGSGNCESLANIYNRIWAPLCGEAGLADRVTRRRKDRNTGEPRDVELWRPRYSPHTLRHAFASILIAGGSKPKKVQTLLGHGSIKLTLDLYGHLWPEDEEDQAIAAAGEALIGGAK